jgi:hypothetical protein
MCMLSRPKRVDIGMCGTSKRSSSSAAYSQTLSGLAEGLSNYNATPPRAPGPVARRCGVVAVVAVGVQPGGNGPAAFGVARP